MPLKKGKRNVGKNIEELHHGPQYQRTKAKHGKKAADEQAKAAAMHAAGVGREEAKPKPRRKRKTR